MSDITALTARIEKLEHELAVQQDIHQIRRLQYTYGYFIDKSQYNEVVDLFADDGDVWFLGGIYQGKAGVRRLYIERFQTNFTQGHNGPRYGWLLDHPQLQMVIDVAPDRRTAQARGRSDDAGRPAPHGRGQPACLVGGWHLRERLRARERCLEDQGAALFPLLARQLRRRLAEDPDRFCPHGEAVLPAGPARPGRTHQSATAIVARDRYRPVPLPASGDRSSRSCSTTAARAKGSRMDETAAWIARAAIAELITRYAALNDAGDWDALAALYLEEGRMNRPTRAGRVRQRARRHPCGLQGAPATCRAAHRGQRAGHARG